MMVAQVALGKTKDLTRVDSSLTAPPAGYDSTRGVPSSGSSMSDFADEEFVVYSLDRQRIRYLIDFALGDDVETLNFDPTPGEPFVGLAPGRPRPVPPMRDFKLPTKEECQATVERDPLLSRVRKAMAQIQDRAPKKEGGLLSSTGEAVPLRSVACRARIVDCLADVRTTHYSLATTLTDPYWNA